MTNMFDILYEFLYGIKCGYSQCCVIWYCTAWIENNLSDYFTIPKSVLDGCGVYQLTEYTFAGANHVLCPDCIAKRVRT